MHFATDHLHILTYRSLYEYWIVMLRGWNENATDWKSTRRRGNRKWREKKREQMANWESEIVICGTLKCSKLGRVENKDICYLVFLLQGQESFSILCAWGMADRRRVENEMRNSREDRKRVCDGDGHLLKVNRGVRALFPLRWQPSPGSLLCHLAYDSLITPILPSCLPSRLPA